MLDEARRAGCRDGDVRPGRRARAAVPGRARSTASSRALLRPPRRGRARALPRARRGASRRELVVLGSRAGSGDDAEERWEERPLKDGSTLAGLQARVRPRRARGRARRRRRAARRPLVRRRARGVTRYRSLASLKRDQARCRACVDGRLPARVAAGDRARARASARTCSGRRPASSRARSGGPGADAPARRCAAGSSSTRTSSTRRSTARR